jgi:hypothetical protein
MIALHAADYLPIYQTRMCDTASTAAWTPECDYWKCLNWADAHFLLNFIFARGFNR